MIDMNRRSRVVIVAIPILLTIAIGVITTLSLPFYSLGPEEISIYEATYETSDFSVQDVTIKYYDPDELEVYFEISGGDGVQNMRLEFICRDINKDHIYASTSGQIFVEVIGGGVSNTISLSINDLVQGTIIWPDVPSGTHDIKAIITLDDIVLNTESFFIDVRTV